MSAQTSALAPAPDSTFTRRAPSPARLAIASIAVAGIVVLGGAAVALSRGSTATVAPTGGFGHVAPMTSAYDRSLETAAMGTSTLIVTSPATGRNARVPADATAVGQAATSPSSATTSVTRTLVITDTNGFAHRLLMP
jgi:hypothetical protein